MSKLPKHLREVQEMFRPKMEEHQRRMKELFEELDSAAVEDFRAKLDAARPVGVSTVEEFLRLLSSPDELDMEMRLVRTSVKTLQ
ncbi:hypothetical protein [Agrobacterium cavarae]|uniref:hypothetical protein n=1 Tax=Agrobacterium cavarae TaxID=2528239 RepID=UPI0028AADE45|nr:hypothetical protein [Agrobacterium cavarae]